MPRDSAVRGPGSTRETPLTVAPSASLEHASAPADRAEQISARSAPVVGTTKAVTRSPFASVHW